MQEELKNVPGIRFVDHVAIAVKQGELEGQVRAYEALGFREIHREEVRGRDQVREALLQIGNGPNLIQLLEPLTADSPVQKLIDKNGGRGGLAHVAFRVENAQHAPRDFNSLTRLRAQARGERWCFLCIPGRRSRARSEF